MVYDFAESEYCSGRTGIGVYGGRHGGVRHLDVKGIKVMPVYKVKGGYRWGKTGKVYKTRAEAEKQGRAIHASGYGKRGSKK